MSNAKSPLEALQDRASLFNRGAHERVKAEVRVTQADGREVFGEISTVGNDYYQHHSQYQFYLLPASADLAPYLLFKAWHHILFKPWYHLNEQYPMRLSVTGDETTFSLESEDELVARTEAILKSERTEQIIRSLSD
jgi:hypothetical protein